MEYAGDRWVRHLRDGTTPRAWHSVLGLSILIVGGAAVLVAELSHPGFTAYAATIRRGSSLILGPIVLIGVGVYFAVSSRIRSRSDRRALALIRASSTPAFYLPVVGSGPVDTHVVMWTLDRDGMHAWTATSKTPLRSVPWSALENVTLAERWVSRVGANQAFRLAFDLDDGDSVIVQCRSTIGRSYLASATKLDILMRVLRSLRRELDRHGD